MRQLKVVGTTSSSPLCVVDVVEWEESVERVVPVEVERREEAIVLGVVGEPGDDFDPEGMLILGRGVAVALSKSYCDPWN